MDTRRMTDAEYKAAEEARLEKYPPNPKCKTCWGSGKIPKTAMVNNKRVIVSYTQCGCFIKRGPKKDLTLAPIKKK